MSSESERLAVLNPAFDRTFKFNPYTGPKIPVYHRRYLLLFSTTPTPKLRIPQEIYSRLSHLLLNTEDVHDAVLALKQEYAFYYENKQDPQTALGLKKAFDEQETSIEVSRELEVSDVLRLVTASIPAPESWRDLQERYSKELTALKSRPEGCSGCQQNALVQRFRWEIEQRLRSRRND